MSIIEPTGECVEKVQAVITDQNVKSARDIYVSKEAEVSANVKEVVWQTNVAQLEAEIASLQADVASFRHGIIDYEAKIAEKQAILATIQPIAEEAFSKLPKVSEELPAIEP